MLPSDDRRAWRWVIAATAVITVVRLAVLAATPLELYPDEAQYWLWSRDLAFGYFSKPPMVAWLIRLTTAFGGDAEPCVRAAAPLLHAGAGLLVFDVGRRLYDARSGLAAFAVYQLAPGVLVSSFVISTDAPLLLFLMLALWLYVALQQAQGQRRLVVASGLGLALGLAFLSKYAALYALIGMAAHLALSREARRAWSTSAALASSAAFAIVVAPNLAWNAAHGFATFAHTAGNADWHGGARFAAAGLGAFILSQFGVFGPVPFTVLVGGGAWLALRRQLTPADATLLAFAAPPLVIMAAEAFIARANANWAAAAYGPGSVLVGAWLMRWKARLWLWVGVGQQALVIAFALVLAVTPSLVDRIGGGNALKRLRGWRQLTRVIVERARTEEGAGPLSAVAMDDRFAFNAAAYYGRDYFGRQGPPLRMWVKGRAPQNQAELDAALTPAQGARVLAVSLEGRNADAIAADFVRTQGREIVSVRLDPQRSRRVVMMLGESYAGPKPPP